MLAPKRTKFRKAHRGSRRGKALAGGAGAFGGDGLQALEPAWVTTQQLEAARVAITRFLKRGGKVWIRVFPDKPYTKKPAETRMGSGKGNPEGWVAGVKPGRVMFELAGVSGGRARGARARGGLFNLRFQLAAGQLDNPMRIKDVRHDVARILTILRERDLGRELEQLE